MQRAFWSASLGWLLLALVGLGVGGCTAGDARRDSPDAADTDAASDADAPSTDDTAASDVADTAPDGDDAVPSGPDFVLGTNVVFEATPGAFTALEDGDEVPITFGPQGAWMIVLSFKARERFGGTFSILGEVTIAGEAAGSLQYAGQETFPGGDGYDYYFNFFLALTRADPPARGTPATVRVRVEDEQTGEVVDVTREVTIGARTN